MALQPASLLVSLKPCFSACLDMASRFYFAPIGPPFNTRVFIDWLAYRARGLPFPWTLAAEHEHAGRRSAIEPQEGQQLSPSAILLGLLSFRAAHLLAPKAVQLL